jgi:hypothetical protein
MAPTKREHRRDETALSFDTTQEIDPAFADLLRRGPEPTLTESEFEALAPELSRRQR